MRTARAREMTGDGTLSVTHTKQGRIVICETSYEGHETYTREAVFLADERRVRRIRALIDRCKRDVRDRFGVELREEIVYLGDF